MTGITENGGIGLWSAECLGCVTIANVDECGLCGECAAKLDRDLIRQRDWDYSVSAFGVSPDKREALRDHVIKRYGAALELIVGSERSEPNWSPGTFRAIWGRERQEVQEVLRARRIAVSPGTDTGRRI
jgi:hypothetical protein